MTPAAWSFNVTAIWLRDAMSDGDAAPNTDSLAPVTTSSARMPNNTPWRSDTPRNCIGPLRPRSRSVSFTSRELAEAAAALGAAALGAGTAGGGAPWAAADVARASAASSAAGGTDTRTRASGPAAFGAGGTAACRGRTTSDTRAAATAGGGTRTAALVIAKRYLRNTAFRVADTTPSSDRSGRSRGHWSQCSQASGRPKNTRAMSACSATSRDRNCRNASSPSQLSSLAGTRITSPQVTNDTTSWSPSATESGRSTVRRAPDREMSLLRAPTRAPSGSTSSAATSASTRARARDCSRSRPAATAADTGTRHMPHQMVFSR